MRFRILTFILFLKLPLCAWAVESKNELWENIKSPFTTDAKYVLLGGTALTLTLLIFEDHISDPIQKETVEDQPLGSTSKLGDALGQLIPNAAYAIGMVGYGKIYNDSRAYRDASLMTQATIYSVGTTTALKYTVREPRPNNPSRKNSFPSGHTTSIFSFASYVGCRHSLPWGLTAYALAGFTAYSRINDNAHYVHDVVAGATIGAAYGLGVCLAEQRRTGKTEEPSTIGYLLPIENGLGAGLTHTF